MAIPFLGGETLVGLSVAVIPTVLVVSETVPVKLFLLVMMIVDVCELPCRIVSVEGLAEME